MVWSLLSELGLSDEVITPQQSGYSLFHAGQLFPVDGGIMGSLGGKAKAIWNTRAVSSIGKLRAAFGALRSSQHDGKDISIAHYAQRRWGKEFSELIIEPLLAGIHAGDSERLSFPALYPQLLGQTMSHKKSPSAECCKSPTIFSLKGGLSSLVDALEQKLPEGSILRGAGVESLSLLSSGKVLLRLKDKSVMSAAGCILATPAHQSASILASELPKEAKLLSGIPFSSTLVANVGFAAGKAKIPFGNGVIATKSSDSLLSACTWTSRKWPGRARKEIMLARCFLHPEKAEKHFRDSQNELQQLVLGELARFLGRRVDPYLVKIERWKNAFPQYEVGHLRRVRALEQFEHLHPQLSLAGASYRGSSIAGCIRDGERSARKLAQVLLQKERPKSQKVQLFSASPDLKNERELYVQ